MHLPSSPIFVFLFVLLTACTVGPDFTPPSRASIREYVPGHWSSKTADTSGPGGAAQQFKAGEDIPDQWWNLYQSPMLDKLVRHALKANPDLQAAEAVLRQARETALSGGGTFGPRVDARLGATHHQLSDNNGGSVFSLFNASLDVTYDLDLFGGNRRRVESLEAQAEIQAYELEAAYLTLTTNIVTAALQEAALRAQIVATEEIIRDQGTRLATLEKLFEAGGIARDAILEQKATIAQSKTVLPELEKQLAQTRHLISALAGDFPSTPLLEEFKLEDLTLPENIPLSLPSSLTSRRPDIRAAAAALHVAATNVGMAQAVQLPQISLSAAFGTDAATPAGLFSLGNLAWNLGGNLLQPVFRGGQLEHAEAAAKAGYDAAAARYRGVVLKAFREVADALRALQADAESLKAQDLALDAAKVRQAQVERQFKMGAIGHLSVLTAEQDYEKIKVARVQAAARRYADTAALFKALGGGWWNRVEKLGQAPSVHQQMDAIRQGKSASFN